MEPTDGEDLLRTLFGPVGPGLGERSRLFEIGSRDFFTPVRAPLIARDAAVATSHPFASAAGLEVLRDGGNAVDAAIAAVATLCVVEPTMTGIGGDCFALYASRRGPTLALNGSGRAPAAATVAAVKEAGLQDAIPRASPHAITVPGAVSAWTRLHADHGSLPLDRLFARAIDYAENGYPVAPRVAYDWAIEAETLARAPGMAATFLPGGVAPRPGDRHAMPLIGHRLREIARHGASAFYDGAVAESLVRYLRGLGGFHSLDDFADGASSAEYGAPLSAAYRGLTVEECPPNAQGLAGLMLLKIFSAFDLGPGLSLTDRIHLHAEATKLVHRARDEEVGEPAAMRSVVEDMLSDETARRLAGEIDMGRAKPPAPWRDAPASDTVALCVVDRDGNAISMMNSLRDPFGAMRLDPETGILLHSRGVAFRLIEGHPNAIGPGKRPLHTVSPALIRREGRIVGTFGVMGAQYQAPGRAAFVSAIRDLDLDPQEALDLPRSLALADGLEVEPTVPATVQAALAGRGHIVRHAAKPLGGGQAILVDEARGVLIAGSDLRRDGCALGF